MSKVQVALGPVQETLMIPLLGRAEESLKPGGLIQDDKAVEMVAKLDYDFSKWRGIRSLAGACVRARMVDEEVLAFLERHPAGSVVEIGAGLNTRFERLDNGTARWLEIDLPDTMALRRRFFQDTERRTLLAASAVETDWLEQVDALPKPVCFVSEAVIIYIDGPKVEALLERLAARYPGGWLITDTCDTPMRDNQDKHDAMQKLSPDAWFRWACDRPADLERLGMRLDRSRSFMDAPAEFVSGMPPLYKWVFRLAPWLIRSKVEGYRINRFCLLGSPASAA
ncbi:MAG: class I SAM-dependent methyltransferase [Myxococcota bacterium]|nr:class I SAM-dependent methyltransferase [Myxococcota bacterium]